MRTSPMKVAKRVGRVAHQELVTMVCAAGVTRGCCGETPDVAIANVADEASVLG